MFVWNVKLNSNTWFKVFFIIVAILIFILGGAACYKIFTEVKSDGDMQNFSPGSSVADITSENYTNILKSVHDDLDTYVGQKIHFVGYVYRVYDLKENQFVLARNMLINSNNQYVIVGFLCEADKAKNFPDNTWVDVTATIQKGDYHGELPILKVQSMKECEKPKDEFVSPPDDTYVPTSIIY